MLLSKVFVTTLNIVNPVNFCSNKQHHTLIELQNEYEGKCFLGVFIIHIDEILSTSYCMVQRTNNSGEGFLHVRFRAKVSLLENNDILLGIKITQHDRVLIGEVAGSEPADINVLISREVESVRVDQIIPGRVVRSIYTPFQIKPAIAVNFLTCDKEAPRYRVIGNLTPEATMPLVALAQQILNQMQIRAEKIKTEMGRTAIWFFESLLYSFKRDSHSDATISTNAPEFENVVDWEGPAQKKELNDQVNLLEILSAATKKSQSMDGVWIRPLEIYRSSPLVCRMKLEENLPTLLPQHLIALYLKSMFNFLQAINNLPEIYNTNELLNSHSNLWIAMRMAQI
jgi:hypothetical protein